MHPIAIEYAARHVLGNLDLFADFLAGECFGAKAIDSDYSTRRPGRLNEADIPTVMHAALVAADRNDAQGCLEAMRLVVQRYLVHADDLLQSKAAEYERDLAGDDKERREQFARFMGFSNAAVQHKEQP